MSSKEFGGAGSGENGQMQEKNAQAHQVGISSAIVHAFIHGWALAKRNAILGGSKMKYSRRKLKTRQQGAAAFCIPPLT